jgi:hypothetical protein
MRPHHKQAGPPEQPACDLLIRATLRSYHKAHGPQEATRRLRRHVAHWPVEARQALAQIARRQEAAIPAALEGLPSAMARSL